MKKVLFLAIVSILVAASSVFAQQTAKTTEFRIGTSYADSADKMGYGGSFYFCNEFDPMLAFGLNPGMMWWNWEYYKKDKNGNRIYTMTDLNGDGTKETKTYKKYDQNAFLIPIMATASIRFPQLKNSIMVVPFFNPGIGYSLMPVKGDSSVALYHGFSWQVSAGAAYTVSDNLAFIFDTGYRRSNISNSDDAEMKMSGWFFNIGATLNVAGSAPYGGPGRGGLGGY